MSNSSAPRFSALTIGVGTTVVMWAVGYVCRVPPVLVPAPVLMGLLLLTILGGGWLAGRYAGGVRGGVIAGVCCGLLNLLIIGSVLRTSESDPLTPSRMIWIPGSILATVLIAAIGAWIGRSNEPRPEVGGWAARFALVTALATLLVLIAGGLVTSHEAGLAVPDWPQSFETNMFLYPLAQMTGGIYYEHAHRLYGALVGLTTIILAFVIWRSFTDRWLRALAIIAVVGVCAQGLLGGLRVTGTLTTSADPAELAPSLGLAVVHGVFGQLFFAFVVTIASVTSCRFRSCGVTPAAPSEAMKSDWTFSALLVGLLIGQLAFGALYRHMSTDETPMPWPAHMHITLAAIVAVVAYLAGLRVWSRAEADPVLKKIGMAVIILTTVQLILGIAAFVAVLARRDDWLTVEVLLATGHQTNGALLLAAAVQMAVWSWRGSRTCSSQTA